MVDFVPRTEILRHLILDTRYGPDLAHVRDLLELERLLAETPAGMAGSLALSNLMGRYSREADAIIHELGVRPFVPYEEARVQALIEERLLFAERRHRPRPVDVRDRSGLSDL